LKNKILAIGILFLFIILTQSSTYARTFNDVDTYYDTLDLSEIGMYDGNNTIWVDRNYDYPNESDGSYLKPYTTIQAGINAATDGDIIFVRSAIYIENIIVDKSVEIIGENKNDTFIDGKTIGTVVTIADDNVKIKNFAILASGVNELSAGIIIQSGNNIISNCIITINLYGIYISENSNENVIAGNLFYKNLLDGICINSNNNLIYGNDIIQNYQYGINVKLGSENIFYHNNFIGNIQNAFFSTEDNIWTENHWDDWIGLRFRILSFLPYHIPGDYLFYFDWNPSTEPLESMACPIAIMNTSMGTMILELYENKTPITSDNFIRLANDEFFNGLVFHRVIDDFVIQGGGYDPDGKLKDSPYGTIDLEIHPDIRHVDGAISMARTDDPNSATSQFFICDGAQERLDDNYAAFGKIISGIQVLRDIASVETTRKHFFFTDWPVEDVVINSVSIELQQL